MHEFNIDLNIPDEYLSPVTEIVKVFRSKGFECYMIGGAVRDLILGNGISEVDFATNARPEIITSLFKKVIPTGIKHGTVTLLKGNKSFEITTYRSDGDYSDGRHPDDVRFSDTLEQDVERRDFTINGLAYDPLAKKVIDYSGGIEDIEKKIIRTIGDPDQRFREDGLRTMRACRFAAKLDFKIEDATLNAISVNSDVIRMISSERIRDELMKMMAADKPSIGLEYMRKTGLLKIILPELDSCYGISQNKYHIYDIYHHSIYSCDSASRNDPIIRVAALFHDIGKLPSRAPASDGENTFYNHEVIGAKIVRRIMKRLKFSNEETEKVNNLIINHMFHYTDEWTDGAVRRFMRKVGLENLEDLFTLRLADRKGNGSREGLPAPIVKLKERINKIIDDENAITVRDLKINGHDLMNEFGLKPGPIIGIVLNQLLEYVLDDPEVNSRDILIGKVREILNNVDVK